jgi:energy-coupling factor transport system permease protein
MGFSYDFYINRKSWMHEIDPRAKLLLSASLMVVCLCVENLWFIAALLIGIHLMLASARVPIDRFAWVWRMMLPVMIMIVALWPIFYREGSTVLLELGFLRVTLESILMGLAMALRISALGFACFILLFTTDQARIVRGLVKLGVPYSVGLTLAIALRYLPTFYGIINMVIDAQKARALDLKKGGIVARLRSYMPILVAVIITGLRTSDNLSHALETRAFGAGGKNRTYLHDLKMTRFDFAFSAGIAVVTMLILLARFRYNFGSDLLRLSL